MRRVAILGALVAVGILALRGRLPKLHEHLMAHCEAMFEQMPDSFPPKKMMRSIEEVRVRTAQIHELLEHRAVDATERETQDVSTVEGVHDAA